MHTRAALDRPPKALRRGVLPIACGVFYLSGFAALLYQVIWQRLLVIFSGADVYSVTVIVAAFMIGLGAGSLAGGRLADAIGPRRCLWAFALAEVSVGGFGLISKPLDYDVLYTHVPQLAAAPGTAASVLLASLLWPTFFMGLSLPLLARALTSRLGLTGRIVGSLYGWNTLGAATGAFLGTWALMPRYGLEQSLWIAATVSFVCALAAVMLALTDAAEVPQAATATDSPPSSSEPLSFREWVPVFGLTGFIALALEIAWFRLLGVMLKSTTFTFGTVLTIYLAGIGLGAALSAGRVARSRRPGMTFLRLQLGAVLYAGGSLIALMSLLAAGHPIRLVRYLGEYEPVDVSGTLALLQQVHLDDPASLRPLLDLAILYLIVPAVLLAPPTLLMGASFAYLQRATHIDLPRLGRRLGVLLVANIAGGALGAVVTGWVLLPQLGTADTFKALVGLGSVLVLPLVRTAWRRQRRQALIRLGSAGLVAASVVVSMPDAQTLWARLHSVPPRQMLFAEDGAGLALLKAERADFSGTVGVYVNGLGQSWIPFGNVHTALGALPALIHPAPATIVVIGLGSGDTAFAAAARPETRHLISVEIIGAQLHTLHALARIQRYPGLMAFLADPRIEHRVGDGRAYVLQSERQFDIIEADALRPGSAYAGNLYSREYFQLLQRRLAPGGIAVTWAPTARTVRTFVSVFPHVLSFEDIYLGSETPIPFDPALVAARAAEAQPYFDAAGVDIVALVRSYLQSPRDFGPGHRREMHDLNTDAFPRDEFALPFR